MASSSAHGGEYSKTDKLSDLLIMQAFLFTETRDIKYAKAMDKVAGLSAMSGSTTCTGNLSVSMFFKFDGPLPRELIAEVQNEFLERVDLEPPRIDDIALAHKVLCTETGPNGDKMGKRLPPKNLYDFLIDLGTDENRVPMANWEHAKLVSTMAIRLDDICNTPYYHLPRQDYRTASEPPLHLELEPGRIADELLPVIAKLKAPLEAQLFTVALRHPALLELVEVYRVVTQIQQPAGNHTVRAMFSELEKFHKAAELEEVMSVEMYNLGRLSDFLLRRLDGGRHED